MEGISLSTASRFKLSFAEATPPKLRASQLREDQHVKEEPQWSQQDKQHGMKEQPTPNKGWMEDQITRKVKEEREEPAQDWSVPEAGATNGRTRSMKL